MSGAWERYRSLYPKMAARLAGLSPVNKGLEVSWRGKAKSPEALLERWVAGLEIGRDAALAVSGVGDGSHIECLLKALPLGCTLICAEPDAQRFRLFLETDVATRILADERVSLGVGKADEVFFEALADFSVMNIEAAKPVVFAPLFDENPSYYEAFFVQFARMLEYWRKLYGTNVVYSGLWQKNTLQNAQQLVAAPDLAELKGCFKGVPMVVAGAGPSLDESLDFLCWAQDRALVVAGNSSFRALRNAGIDPHFVMAVDPNPSTDLGFEGVSDFGRSVLLCNYMVYPKVPERFGKRIVTWSSGNGIASYIRANLGLGKGATVTEQGTVSACAFDLAKILGCPTLYLAGQDMAVRTDGTTHAADSFYTDAGHNRIDLSGVRWLPGNTAETVPVEEKLFVYLKTFEALAAEHRNRISVRNLSRLGARIEGVPYEDLEAARENLEEIGDATRLGKGWALVEKQCGRTWIGWGRARRELSKFEDYARRICERALSAALRLESETVEARVAIGLQREVDDLVSSDELLEILFKDGQYKIEMLAHERSKKALAKLSGGKLDEIEVIKSYLWAVAEAAYHLCGAFEVSKTQTV